MQSGRPSSLQSARSPSTGTDSRSESPEEPIQLSKQDSKLDKEDNDVDIVKAEPDKGEQSEKGEPSEKGDSEKGDSEKEDSEKEDSEKGEPERHESVKGGSENGEPENGTPANPSRLSNRMSNTPSLDNVDLDDDLPSKPKGQ